MVTHVELLGNFHLFICSAELCLFVLLLSRIRAKVSPNRLNPSTCSLQRWAETMHFISSSVIFSIWPNYRLMPDIQLATHIVRVNPFLFWFSLRCIRTIWTQSSQCGDGNRNWTQVQNAFHFRLNPFAIQQMCAITICTNASMHHILNKMHQMALNCYSNNSVVAYTLASCCAGIRGNMHRKHKITIDSEAICNAPTQSFSLSNTHTYTNTKPDMHTNCNSKLSWKCFS